MAYDSIDPIGKRRDDYGWAMVCSVVYNLALDIHAKKGTRPKRTTPSDFMPDWDGTGKKMRKTQSIEEQKSILLNLARRHNKMHSRKRKKHG